MILATIPEIPGIPVHVSAAQTTITINWEATDDGGTPLTSYNVQINSGAGGTYELAGSVTSGT